MEGRWLLIGHRGVGKTTFLRDMRPHFEHCIDLDEEIEKRSGGSVLDLFERYGEKAFREIETATFEGLLREHGPSTSLLIALGAGFSGKIWPTGFKCLWLRKESDIWPRFFLDRPATGTSVPEKFFEAFLEREKRYQTWCDLALTLPEGYGALKGSEHKISWPLGLNCGSTAYLTLAPQLHRDPMKAIEERRPWALGYELRTDFWPEHVILKILREKKNDRFIVSFRGKDPSRPSILSRSEIGEHLIDWEIGLGADEESLRPDILSLHDFSGGLSAGLRQLEAASVGREKVLLKASPVLEYFSQLAELEDWRRKDPLKRLIFPRSKITDEAPRWQWFRLLLKGRQPIHFLREASEGVKDQPTVEEFASHCVGESFAAVLGDTVMHSYSPWMHRSFFAEKGMPFLAVPISRGELSLESLTHLEAMGARAFAVTSPHKENVSLLDFAGIKEKKGPFPINTLMKLDQWRAFNTDEIGINRILDHFGRDQFWKVWGSGSVAKQFFSRTKNAELYSQRSRSLVEMKGRPQGNSPAHLFWAGSEVDAFPPEDWIIDQVVDLSYLERSPAILLAQRKKLPYKSGLEFFTAQARAQQEIWAELPIRDTR